MPISDMHYNIVLGVMPIFGPKTKYFLKWWCSYLSSKTVDDNFAHLNAYSLTGRTIRLRKKIIFPPSFPPWYFFLPNISCPRPLAKESWNYFLWQLFASNASFPFSVLYVWKTFLGTCWLFWKFDNPFYSLKSKRDENFQTTFIC